MKYIRTDSDRIVVFDDNFNHVDIANIVDYDNVVSAGFCIVAKNGIMVHGESLSLKLKPLEDDAKVIGKFLGGGNHTSVK